VRVASTLGKEFEGFQIQRISQKGEKVSDIIEESKQLTFEVGEVAVVRLKDGRRAIVTAVEMASISELETSTERNTGAEIRGHTYLTGVLAKLDG
jgi:translation elongation factor EF-Tu-like GTPase